MELPKLIETQLESYTQFLQQHVEAGARENKGLEEVFKLYFPLLACQAMLPLNMFPMN